MTKLFENQNDAVTSKFTRDRSWVRKAFMLDGKNLDANVKKWRTYSNVFNKFTNTSLGGNFAINSLPSYTQYADIMSPGVAIHNYQHKSYGESNSTGMGRYYSEAIDDQAQLLHMRFGTPRFQGLISFFTSFYSHEAGMLAREGRVSWSYYIAKTAVTVVTLPIQLAITTFTTVGSIINFFAGVPSTKYYYMVQAMGPYWNRVNLIVNQLAVHFGIAPLVYSSLGADGAGKVPQTNMNGEEETDDYRKYAARAYPGIFDDNGQVDVRKVANRARRLQNARYAQLEAIGLKAKNPGDVAKLFADFIANTKVSDPGDVDMRAYMKQFHEGPLGNPSYAANDDITDKVNSMDMNAAATTAAPAEGETAAGDTAMGEGEASTGTPPPAAKSVADLKNGKNAEPYSRRMPADDEGNENLITGFFSQMKQQLRADIGEGSQFVTFKVDYTGPGGESFSNSFEEPAISSTLNGLSSTARQVRFTLSDGNTGSDVIDGITNSIRDFATGTLDGLYLGGLLALAGNANVDIPKVWSGSSSQMPTMSYTMELRTWCGNRYGQFMNLVVPTAMLLAGALPISTGPQSYTAPFLCEAYCKGRAQTRLGMIESLNIQRYAGTLGSNNEHQALGYDISFTIADLNSILHMPIDSGFNIREPLKLIFDNDNAFKDYCAVLGSASLADQVYVSRKLAINLTQAKLRVDSWWSWSHVSNRLGNLNSVQALASIFTQDNARAYL